MTWENPYTLGGRSTARDRHRVPWWVDAYPDGHELAELTVAEEDHHRGGMFPRTVTTVAVTYRCSCGTSWTDTRFGPPDPHHVLTRFGDHTWPATGQRPQRLPAYGPGRYPKEANA